MAETLSVTDMLPNKFEPKRKFRWVFAIEGIDAFLMKTAARPTINTAEQEISYMNSTRYLAGKTKFDGNRASIKQEDFNSIPEPYVNKDLSFPRMWIESDNKLFNVPVIFS